MPGQHTTGGTPATRLPQRDGGLDALRASATLLVVFHHTAITYGAIGGWYYHEEVPHHGLQTSLLILFCTINQAWFMGLFFLLAGYFTPAALDRKGAVRWFADRLLRLGLPLIVYGFVIGPATIALAQTAQGHPFCATLLTLWRRADFENGPLWFAQALLMVSLVCLGWRWLAPGAGRWAAFPSNRALLTTAIATGVGAFVLRLIWPVGTNVAGLQLGYFASYIVLFGAGYCAAPGGWLSRVPAAQRRLWRVLALVTLPILPAIVFAARVIPFFRGDPAGGWNVAAAIYALWEPFVAWGIILSLLHSFQCRYKQLGLIWTALARRAFGIYIIHPPILVAVALAWRSVAAPQLMKFLVSGTATCLLCFWCVGMLLRAKPISHVI